MNTLIHALLQRGNYNAPAGAEPAAQNDAELNYRPNRQDRRRMAKIHQGQRWDKRLAAHYGIPKMFIQHARRHGGSTEMILSELLQQNAIKYRELPEAK